MSKVSVIIAREYLARVKKKSFIFTTLFFPIMMAALILLPLYIANKADKNCTIYVLDDNDYFINKFHNTSKLTFVYPGDELNVLQKKCINGECDAVLHILSGSQSNQANLYYYEEPPMSLKGKITEQMDQILFDRSIVDTFHIDLQKFKVIKEVSRSSIATLQIDKNGQAEKHTVEINRIVGMICGMLIYIFVFLYSSIIMRSTIEEKTNRIAEIIVSSVKPFQFMMGKIIGVSLVGITQFVLQIIFVLVLLTGAQFVVPQLINEKQVTEMSAVTNMNTNSELISENATINTQDDIFGDISSFYTFPFKTILFSFFFYFLFGYLMYASLYAGLGSATDNETDSNQLIMPVSLPLIITFIVIMMGLGPEHTVIRWLSIIPFTSPIAMLYRLPSGVPVWEFTLSTVLLVATFIGCVWFSAKIYRIGLLSYGKKVTWAELIRWVRIR